MRERRMATDALMRSVRATFLHEWDPIVDEPAAQGEYDHLRHLETDMIGLPGDAARTRRAAEVLASLSL
jgi:hypothetical protein